MERRAVNPWRWQERFGFSQAWRVEQPGAVVYLAGQGPFSAEGELVGAGDFEAQVRQTFANLGTVLAEAGAGFGDVVRTTVYLTDITRLRDFGRIRAEFLTGPPPASTALQVVALAIPGMEVEVDAIAVL